MRISWAAGILLPVLAAGVVGGCGAIAPPAESPTSRAGTGTSDAPTGPSPSAASPVGTSPTPAPSAPPMTGPTPEPLVLGGTWVKPKAGGRMTSYTTTLSARPTATGDGVTTFTEVVFSAAWAGAAPKTACRATEPGRNGAWSCMANLLALGVPPGRVTFSFDVAGAGVPVAESPDGPRRVTYAVKPPRPTKTRLLQIEQPDYERGDDHPLLHDVRWSAPAGYADEFLVYETWECPRPSTRQNSGKPCFAAGTKVDTSRLELVATAPGDASSVKVRLTEYECGPSHGTILLRARNSYGQSVFAIVEAAPVVWVAPGDTMC